MGDREDGGLARAARAGRAWAPLDHRGAYRDLAAVLRDPYPWFAIGAARSLGQARAVAAVPALVATLNARNHAVRAAAAQALGAIHDERAFDPILALLHR